MPSPNPTLRREYKGAAAASTLQNSMLSTDVSFVLVAANNWPTGAVGKFVVTINRGQADEEKILCDSQSGRTVACLLANRGFDGTTAQSHSAGATAECTISAFDADEWNQHTNATSGVHGVTTVVGTTDVQSLSNKTIDATSTLGGVSGTTLAAERAAWSTYAPQWSASTNPTLSTNTGHYSQTGKKVVAQSIVVASGPATAGTFLSNAPVAIASGPAQQSPLGTFAWFVASSGVTRTGVVWYNSGTTLIQFKLDNTTTYLTAAIAAGDSLAFNLSYEAA